MLVIIRSVVFNMLFYLNMVVLMCLALPTLLLPRWGILGVVRFWARSNNWLLRIICGITVELRGLERIPPGPLLIAAKHQSLWETFALVPLFADPAFILKRELMWVPLWGWLARPRGGLMEIWPAVHTERKALAGDLRGLSDEDWAKPSLCGNWTELDSICDSGCVTPASGCASFVSTRRLPSFLG